MAHNNKIGGSNASSGRGHHVESTSAPRASATGQAKKDAGVKAKPDYTRVLGNAPGQGAGRGLFKGPSGSSRPFSQGPGARGGSTGARGGGLTGFGMRQRGSTQSGDGRKNPRSIGLALPADPNHAAAGKAEGAHAVGSQGGAGQGESVGQSNQEQNSGFRNEPTHTPVQEVGKEVGRPNLKYGLTIRAIPLREIKRRAPTYEMPNRHILENDLVSNIHEMDFNAALNGGSSRIDLSVHSEDEDPTLVFAVANIERKDALGKIVVEKKVTAAAVVDFIDSEGAMQIKSFNYADLFDGARLGSKLHSDARGVYEIEYPTDSEDPVTASSAKLAEARMERAKAVFVKTNPATGMPFTPQALAAMDENIQKLEKRHNALEIAELKQNIERTTRELSFLDVDKAVEEAKRRRALEGAEPLADGEIEEVKAQVAKQIAEKRSQLAGFEDLLGEVQLKSALSAWMKAEKMSSTPWGFMKTDLIKDFRTADNAHFAIAAGIEEKIDAAAESGRPFPFDLIAIDEGGSKVYEGTVDVWDGKAKKVKVRWVQSPDRHDFTLEDGRVLPPGLPDVDLGPRNPPPDASMFEIGPDGGGKAQAEQRLADGLAKESTPAYRLSTLPPALIAPLGGSKEKAHEVLVNAIQTQRARTRTDPSQEEDSPELVAIDPDNSKVYEWAIPVEVPGKGVSKVKLRWAVEAGSGRAIIETGQLLQGDETDVELPPRDEFGTAVD